MSRSSWPPKHARPGWRHPGPDRLPARVPLSRDLRPVYAAADEAAAAAVLDDFAAPWQDRYPAIVRLWRAHSSEFTPFLAFPPEVRRVIYTTDRVDKRPAAQGRP